MEHYGLPAAGKPRFMRDVGTWKREKMKFNHIGIPTKIPQDGEVYLKEYDVYCTDHESNPFGIQWMRYGNKCMLPKIVKEIVHVAFEVDDLRKAIEGREVIIEPNSPSQGVTVAFVLENGAPVELLEFEKSQQSDGG